MKNNATYDLAAEMDKYLNPDAIERRAGANAIDEALYNLDKAAEILDAMGKFGAAEAVTKVMEHVSHVAQSGTVKVALASKEDNFPEPVKEEDHDKLRQEYAMALEGFNVPR